jgi:hypothetical protein
MGRVWGELHESAEPVLQSLERKLADARLRGAAPETMAELEAALAEIRAALGHSDLKSA